MNAKDRAKFRTTKIWKDFRNKMKQVFQGVDWITRAKLYTGWNLHHLDLNSEHYDNLDQHNFIPLNKTTHDTIHFLYLQYLRDPDVLQRLKTVLDKMKSLNIK